MVLLLVQLRYVRKERVRRPFEETMIVERTIMVGRARRFPVLAVDSPREALKAILDRGARLELFKKAPENRQCARALSR